MEDKTLNALEYDKILRIVAEFCVLRESAENIRAEKSRDGL